MKIIIESVEECLEAAYAVRDFLKRADKYHCIESCACDLCKGYRVAKDLAERMKRQVDVDEDLKRRMELEK